ncbi:TatD family hydrolase [Polaribacter sp. MSW13]|uniref:TatD family hydrolase n=1 Tax=Polaribacter marinus TaxID=2916838 RepID=A0A9X1VLU4_9FLAO|nr:TatD family hydrolase [Polaribacter marinus]MCI2228874.1 TatD family hydrolase [Polaribacter marinus]
MLFFDVHTHKTCSVEDVFSIVNKYPNSTNFSRPFSIGIHPWFAKQETLEEELLFVEHQIQNNNCLAVGECGLDKRSLTNFEFQKAVFIKQILLSEKYQKPLMIHCVKAHQEIIEIKKELKPIQTWLFHGFNKNSQIAKSLLKNRIILSIGPVIIKNTKLQEVFLELPLSSILLETDDTEIEIREVYQKASEIKKKRIEELQQVLHQNFKDIFIK